MGQGDSTRTENVLVFAPLARDATATRDFLTASGIPTQSCTRMEELCAALESAPRVALLTEEALAGDALRRLATTVAALPAGHELPIVVLLASRTRPAPVEFVRRFTDVLAGAVLVVRPVHPVALLSTVQTAMRTWRRVRASAVHEGNGVADARVGAEAARLRTALRGVPLTLFEQDRDLRYTWVHNAFAGMRAEALIGRDDTEWLGVAEEGARLQAFKREVLDTGVGGRERVRLTLDDGPHDFDFSIEPRHDDSGRTVGVTGAALRIDEYVALQERLRRQAEQLARMDQRKNDFIAQLAHELRNPLAPIYNALHVLKIQPQPPDPAHLKWAIEVIGRQLHQISRLVDDLLDIARITHGGLNLRLEALELGRTLLQAVELTRPQTTARKQVLTYSPPVEPIRVQADPARLLQIVGNLLNNASRYTPSGGHIALSVRRDADQAVITVADDGVGIAPEALPHIFEPFYQGERRSSQAQAGVGLGLTLVRQLVELHRGSVEAHSPGPGGGSTFCVRLPLLPDAAPGEAIPKVHTDITSGRRVLVVEDDPDVAHSFVLLLRMMGHDAEAARNGVSALAAVERYRPHVIFVDIALPDMDGYQIARAIRAKNIEPPPRLVALSGYGHEDMPRRVAEAGFDAHLIKPATAETLERLLASLQVPS